MRKVIYLVLIILFSAPKFFNLYSVQPETKCITLAIPENYKLVASLPNENINLFALPNDLKNKDSYNKFLLSMNRKAVILNWKNTANPAFPPRLFLSDINNDGINELIAILTTGTGSDLHIENIHVLQLFNLNEIIVDDPISIIKKKVHTGITNKNNKEKLITITIDNSTTEIIINKNFTAVWFNDVAFGSEIHWKVFNDRIYADIDAQISPSVYVGTIEIEYEFKENKLTLSKIQFIEKK